MRNLRQSVLTVDIRQELRILDSRPWLDSPKRIFGRYELFMRQHVVFFGRFGEMFAEQIPAGKNDIGIIRKTVDTQSRERKPIGADDALFQKLDAGGHGRS